MATDDEFLKKALEYHALPKPGKLSTHITKPTNSQKDLALAYSPGVAEPVREIVKDPANASLYTARSNLVGVITNGTAVLGLGNVGPLASKPVMEGKAVLFKRFADIDVFDIEIDAENPQTFINTVARLAPTFGGINLEDIKGPQCFEIEQALNERLDIPVFHDDQHGTAIIIAAALLNALELQKKSLSDIRIVCLGAGAAGIASMKLLMHLGVSRDQIFMVDSKGVIHSEREDLNPHKFAFAQETQHRTLCDVIDGADVFIGVSGANLLTPTMLEQMNENPVVFALSNPDPEIHPALAKSIRKDVIIATGRSDFPNQVNNVLCFPFLFRGALDVEATQINQSMMVAAVEGIRHLAKEDVPESVLASYELNGGLHFGPDYILPTPLDPRLMQIVPPLVARAAIESGVAKKPYPAHYPQSYNPGAISEKSA